MSPRRVHGLMSKHFPVFSPVEHDWKNIVGTGVATAALLQELLDAHIGAKDVLVEVHRNLGAMLSTKEAVSFVCLHIGVGQIQVANREFNAFVVVAQNGVATGWQEQKPFPVEVKT